MLNIFGCPFSNNCCRNNRDRRDDRREDRCDDRRDNRCDRRDD